MSAFVIHHTEQLFSTALSLPKKPNSLLPTVTYLPSEKTQRLQALLAAVHPRCPSHNIRDILLLLQSDEKSVIDDTRIDCERRSLRRAAIGIIIVWIYSQALDLCLRQATEADSEANWWYELERSRHKLAWYFLETLPLRMKRVFDTVVNALRARNLAITPFSFTPASLRELFPTVLIPSRLSVSFFPHLSTQPHMLFRSPLGLVRQECQYQRRSLQEIRDDRAQRLGSLVSCRDGIQAVLASYTADLTPFTNIIQEVIEDMDFLWADEAENSQVKKLLEIVCHRLPQAPISHNARISFFLRPSRLTRIWPQLVLVPPITLLLFRVVYGARGSLREHFTRAIETISGFWKGYLIEPCREILDTVRTGGEEGVRIVRQEGVRSDMESLERMVVSLTREKYTLTASELDNLSMQIRGGDLSSVLRIYEEDLKSPLKSAIAGSLIRSLLIQVQKMKVDVDVALSGIDKLLKSQELTFAFVGVAPSLAILYGLVGWVRNVWHSGRGKGRYGGRGKRRAVWLSIRRIERLLTLSAARSFSESTQLESLSSLDQGLILLSVAQLRAYAETYFSRGSTLREEFLVDVSDLEDPNLGRREKREIVKRMWRSWGTTLEWTSLGEP